VIKIDVFFLGLFQSYPIIIILFLSYFSYLSIFLPLLFTADHELNGVATALDPVANLFVRLTTRCLAIDLDHQIIGPESSEMGWRAGLHRRDYWQSALLLALLALALALALVAAAPRQRSA